jgi:hypothetical protein
VPQRAISNVQGVLAMSHHGYQLHLRPVGEVGGLSTTMRPFSTLALIETITRRVAMPVVRADVRAATQPPPRVAMPAASWTSRRRRTLDRLGVSSSVSQAYLLFARAEIGRAARLDLPRPGAGIRLGLVVEQRLRSERHAAPREAAKSDRQPAARGPDARASPATRRSTPRVWCGTFAPRR